MSEKERIKIEPDLDFIQDIMDNGGDTLKKCFQCGTCSVVCNLAPDDSPFPRKEMIWAQWGLKDNLISDPDVWNCFQCSDCSAYCPRGASPGDVLSAVRKKVIEGLAWPSFMGRMVADPQYLPFLVGFPALIILVVLLYNGTGNLESPVLYGSMITHLQLNLVFPTFAGLAALAFLMGINKIWTGASGEGLIGFLPKSDKARLVGASIDVITDIVAHKDFDQCGTNHWRKLAHQLVLFGFIGLLITTVLAIVVLVPAEFFHWYGFGHYPLAPLHPVKWLGNASGIALLAGSWLMIQNRKKMAETGDMKSSYFDLFFLYVVFGVGLTGMLSQFLRFADVAIIAYPTYFVHLVLVFTLLIYSPYSKFAHFVYRTVALIYKRYEELGAEAGESAADEAAA